MISYDHPEVASICWTYPFGYRDDLANAPGSVHVVEHMIIDGAGHGALRKLSSRGVLLNARTLADTMQFTYTFHPAQAASVVAAHAALIEADPSPLAAVHATRIVAQETLESAAKLDGRRENWVELQQASFSSASFSSDGFGYKVSEWGTDELAHVVALADRIRSTQPTVVACGQLELSRLRRIASTSATVRPLAEITDRKASLSVGSAGRPHNYSSRHLLGIPAAYDTLGSDQYLAVWLLAEALRCQLRLRVAGADVGMGMFGPFGLLQSDCLAILYTSTASSPVLDVDLTRDALAEVIDRLVDETYVSDLRATVSRKLQLILQSPDQQASVAAKLALVGGPGIADLGSRIQGLTPEQVLQEALTLQQQPIASVAERSLP